MQSDDGRAIAKRCYLCKATPGAVGKRGEGDCADRGRRGSGVGMEKERRLPDPRKRGETIPGDYYKISRYARDRKYTAIPAVLGILYYMFWQGDPLFLVVGLAVTRMWSMSLEAAEIRDCLYEVAQKLYYTECSVEKLLGHPVGLPPETRFPPDISDPRE